MTKGAIYKSKVIGLSTQEIASLVPSEVDAFFVQGQKWKFSRTLRQGGVVIFPHTLIRTIGDQVAAVVDGCLDSGAERVVVLGVLHSLDRAHIIKARRSAKMGHDVSNEPCRGIFGPNFPGDQTWRSEFSLESFCYLWNYAVKKRKLANPPELIVAYPCISNDEPWTLRGIEQLKSYLPGSVIVATVDFCHHGVAYAGTLEPIIPMNREAEKFALDIIEEGFEIIRRKDHVALRDYCHRTVCDGVDVIQLLMYLLGPFDSRIVGFRLVDVVHLYEHDPAPSWVAASLIEMQPSL